MYTEIRVLAMGHRATITTPFPTVEETAEILGISVSRAKRLAGLSVKQEGTVQRRRTRATNKTHASKEKRSSKSSR
jgi:hypothetical protein